MPLPPLIILTGPTGVGKSELGSALAENLNGEIISADSMQVYKYFDIGSAKPSYKLRKKVPHHLVDILEPDEEYNASLFREDAEKIIRRLHGEGKTPVVVGGTGLYIKSLTHGLECATEPSPAIRQEIRWEMKQKGVEKMHGELARVDPVSSRVISPNDPVRIERALEVYRSTGRPLSEFNKQDIKKSAPRFDISLIVLNAPRNYLYSRIETRVDSMMEEGLVDEVLDLLKRGYSRKLKPFMGLGYKQVLTLIDGVDSLQTVVDSIKKETRHYAKRQLTWFRKMEGARWVFFEEGDLPETILEKILGCVQKITVFSAKSR
jgi:tRNA dimethylallyltransferase